MNRVMLREPRGMTCVFVGCLIGGMALNALVALAISLAAQQIPGVPTGSAVGSPARTLEEYQALDARVQNLQHWALMERPGYTEFNFFTQAPDFRDNALLVEIETGWPWKSLRRVDRMEMNNSEWMRLYLSFRTQPRVASADAEGFLIPTTPIWSGFVLNSCLYAALLLMAFVIAPATRRQMRSRRGLCQQCAYPIGVGDRCTECGKPVPPTTTRKFGTSDVNS